MSNQSENRHVLPEQASQTILHPNGDLTGRVSLRYLSVYIGSSRSLVQLPVLCMQCSLHSVGFTEEEIIRCDQQIFGASAVAGHSSIETSGDDIDHGGTIPGNINLTSTDFGITEGSQSWDVISIDNSEASEENLRDKIIQQAPDPYRSRDDEWFERLLNDPNSSDFHESAGSNFTEDIRDSFSFEDFVASSLPSSSSSSSCGDDLSSNAIVLETRPSSSVPPHAPVATRAAVPLPTNNTNNRFLCTHPNCSADFARAGDLRRHQRVHGAPAHPCTVNGCFRKGERASYRHDKLLDHLRKKHGLTV